MDTNVIGAISELEASIWLMQQGYAVFHNVKATGPADIIAWNPETNETLIVDVKTIRRKSNGEYVQQKKTGRNKYVKYLGFCPDDSTFTWI